MIKNAVKYTTSINNRIHIYTNNVLVKCTYNMPNIGYNIMQLTNLLITIPGMTNCISQAILSFSWTQKAGRTKRFLMMQCSMNSITCLAWNSNKSAVIYNWQAQYCRKASLVSWCISFLWRHYFNLAAESAFCWRIYRQAKQLAFHL